MKTNAKKYGFYGLLLLFFVVALPLVLSSCTSVSNVIEFPSGVSAQKLHPAHFDVGSARSIAIAPFAASARSNGGASSAEIDLVTGGVANIYDVTSSPLVSKEALASASLLDVYLQKAVKNAGQLRLRSRKADIFLLGALTGFSVADTLETVPVSAKNDVNANASANAQNAPTNAQQYFRTVVVTVEYGVFSKKGALIGRNQKSILAKSKGAPSVEKLARPEEIVHVRLPVLASLMLEDVQAFEQNPRIFILSSPKTKRMRSAYKLFQQGAYSKARDAYNAIYRDNALFEAGYNAARIMHIKGDLLDAKTLMSELFERYKDERAALALYEIEKEIEQKTSKKMSKLKNVENVEFFEAKFNTMPTVQ